MATLFLGRRQGASGFAKHVAIKLVHPHLVGDDTFTKMFVDEALLSSRIHHPNVVHVEELGEVGGTHFLVMEYVHGGSLGQLLKCLAIAKRRMVPELATSIAIAAADGLHAAHDTTGRDGQPLGVVHRDVTPENILIAFKGHVKVIDFGVAKARDRATQTVAGTLKGKFAYMAPEQAMGTTVDRRTDVYALGIVLWEMLTMRRCFKAPNDLLLLDMVRAPNIPPPHRIVPNIDPKLSAAVMKALAPNPDDRPATAQAFRRLLADAAPRALAMDSSHLADLLGSVMKEEIAKEQEALPSEISSVVVPTVSDPNAINALTVVLGAPSAPRPVQPPPSVAPLIADATIDEEATTQAMSREEAMAAIGMGPAGTGPHGTLPRGTGPHGTLNPPSGPFSVQPALQSSGSIPLPHSGQFPTTPSLTPGPQPGFADAPQQQGSGKSKLLLLLACAALVVGVLGAGAFFVFFGSEEPTATALPPAVEGTSTDLQQAEAEALQRAAEETARQQAEAAERAAEVARQTAAAELAAQAEAPTASAMSDQRRARRGAPESDEGDEAATATAAERLRELTAMDQPVELVTTMGSITTAMATMATMAEMAETDAEREARAERRRRRRERRLAQMNMSGMGTIIVTDPGF